MWDAFKRDPRGRISLRNLVLLATSLIVAVLANLSISQVVLAVDAFRTTDGFSYEDKSFTNERKLAAGDPLLPFLSTNPSSMVGTTVFEHRAGNVAELLIFAPGVDPQSSSSALHQSFTFAPPSNYSNPSSAKTVVVSDQGLTTSPSIPDSMEDSGSTSSCAVPGVGWIVCTVSEYIAEGVDLAYTVTQQFLLVWPLAINNSGVYKLWDIMRSFANICFVIAFLIIIYSQVTSAGINSYGLRKMLPRLVIAAVLVNVSFFVSSLAIDISNFLGYALYSLFESIFATLGTFPSELNLTTITLAAIGGVPLALGGVVWFAVAAGGSVTSLTFMLLSFLIGMAFSVITAFIILAARQALIVVFTIISPLAFAAMILPSTEKWFTKWRSSFLTLLMMFPIFAVLFGGAQVAGRAIIIGAGGNPIVVLLGFAVQIIPLALTPLLVKLSTGILGTIANMTNNKNKGPADRLKNWSNSRADYFKKRALGEERRKLGFRGLAQALDNTRRRQELEAKKFDTQAETRALNKNSRYRSARRYQEAVYANKQAELDKGTIDDDINAEWDRRRRTAPKVLRSEILNREAKTAAKLQADKLEKMHEEITAEGESSAHIRELQNVSVDLRRELNASAGKIRSDSEEIVLTGIAKKMAERKQQDNVANVLKDNERTYDGLLARAYAGGIQEQGQYSALASAITTQRKQYAESVSEMSELIKQFNPSTNDLQNMIAGRNAAAVGKYKDSQGREQTFEFSRDNIYAMEAALENNVTIGTVGMVDEIIAKSGSELAEYRTTISSALAKAGHAGRSIYQGGRLISEVAEGNIHSEDDLTAFVQSVIADGKFSTVQLSNLDEPAAKRFLKAATSPILRLFDDPTEQASFEANFRSGIQNLANKARTATTSDQTRDNVKENTRPILERIERL